MFFISRHLHVHCCCGLATRRARPSSGPAAQQPAQWATERGGDLCLPRPAVASVWFHSSPSSLGSRRGGTIRGPQVNRDGSLDISAIYTSIHSPTSTHPLPPSTLDVNNNIVQEVFDGMPMRLLLKSFEDQDVLLVIVTKTRLN